MGLGFLVLLAGLGPGFEGRGQQAPDVDSRWEQAAEESLWYSLYNVESLLLFSGMGAPLGPAERARAGLSPADLPGFYPLVAPFRSGLPQYAQPPDPDRGETLRWRPREAEQTISLEGLAFAVIAELGWAARLEQLLRAQTDSRTLAREARLLRGMARAAADWAERKLRRPDGLYHNALRWWRDLPLAEGPPPWRGQIAWLWALASLATSDRDPEILARADALFRTLEEGLPWDGLSVRDASLALKALAWYAFAAESLEEEERALQAVRRVDALAERLLSTAYPSPREPAVEVGVGAETEEKGGVGDLAAIVGALSYAHRLTGEGRYLRGAERAWELLMQYWRDDLGLFLPPSELGSPRWELTVADAAELLGAFHARIHVARSEEALRLYPRFLEGLKRAGLQRAEGREAGGSFDGDPVPSLVEAGEPPVLVAAVRFDPDAQRWRVADGRFLSAPALYAAVNWLWLGRLRGEGFAGPPRQGVPTSPLAMRLFLPRRVSAVEESLFALEAAVGEIRTALEELRTQLDDLRTRLRAQPQEWASREELRALERKLLDRVEEGLRALREEIQALPAPTVDEEALTERVGARLEERIAGTLAPQIEALAEGLARLQERIETLAAAQPQAQGQEQAQARLQEDLARLEAQVRNLRERVGALEERVVARWRLPVRREALLLAAVVLGLALLVVGFLQLRRLRGA